MYAWVNVEKIYIWLAGTSKQTVHKNLGSVVFVKSHACLASRFTGDSGLRIGHPRVVQCLLCIGAEGYKELSWMRVDSGGLDSLKGL